VSVSVVVPVYNAERSLGELVAATKSALNCVDAFEIIFVNDASQDGSWQVICDLMRNEPRIRGLNLMRNYGQHNAVLCGIRAAKFGIIVTLDDDLQNPPDEIPKLLAKLDEGYDVVYGFPKKQKHGLWRGLASLITKWVLQKAMGAQTAASISSFRAFRTDLRGAFEKHSSHFVNIDALLTWGTTKFVAVPVKHDARPYGESNYTFFKLVTHALNMVTGLSTFPLQLASLNGFACMLFGILALIYVLAQYIINGGSVPGFPFLAALIVILSGAQLFALGIIGEYLARMYARTSERPAYVVRPNTTVELSNTDKPSSPSTIDFTPVVEALELVK
jgi:glycosyltransferase involved in cell wall biosynthesis